MLYPPMETSTALTFGAAWTTWRYAKSIGVRSENFGEKTYFFPKWNFHSSGRWLFDDKVLGILESFGSQIGRLLRTSHFLMNHSMHWKNLGNLGNYWKFQLLVQSQWSKFVSMQRKRWWELRIKIECYSGNWFGCLGNQCCFGSWFGCLGNQNLEQL